MAPPNHPSRWWPAPLRICLVLSGSLFATLIPQNTSAAVEVDTELLLLVDVSGSVTSDQFSSLLNSYARAVTSSSVLDAIQSGNYGKIAATLVFWGGETSQVVAVPWMEISNATQAADFSSLLLSATRPFEGRTAIGSALDFSVPLFGTETGANDNGFSSLVQIIDISGDGVDNSTPPRGDRSVNVRDARDRALAAGVDMINGLPIGDTNGSLVAYYEENVIGGKIDEIDAFVERADTYEALEQSLVTKLTREISVGARSGAVPEPSTTLSAAAGSMLLFIRRRRSL